MGGEPTTGMSALPTRPKTRGPDDDGSFKRRDYNDSRRDQEPSRSDGDDNWRRGGGSSMGGSSRAGGGYDDRRDGGGFNRQGGGGYDRHGTTRDGDSGGFDRRSGYNDNRNSFDNFDRRGGNRGGYDNHNDRGESGFDSFRRGGHDRGTAAGDSRNLSSSQTGGSIGSGMRPRLKLKTRTAPQPEPAHPEGNDDIATAHEQPKEEKTVPEAEEVKEVLALPIKEEKVQVDTTAPASGQDGWEVVEGVKTKPSKENQTSKSTDKVDISESGEKKPSKKHEPVVVNSRAAMLESAPDVKRDSNNGSHNRKESERSRGPPPVVNKRFEQLAVEERGKQKDRDLRREPPPITNSRFAAAAEADKDVHNHRDESKTFNDPPTVTNSRFAAAAESYKNNRSDLHENRARGPPPVANSRFAAAAEADRDRSYNRNDLDRGPPPVANSRFAAAAEADKDYNYNREKNVDRLSDRDRGPPPVANSRFAAAAEADSDYNYNREKNVDRFSDRDRGPPPVANSRFAAAAEADSDYNYNREKNVDRLSDRDRGPPPVANSRFAAAAEADRDYGRDRDDFNGGRGDRGPPPQENSRFAAAAEADRDTGYNRDGNNGKMDDRDRGPPPVANSRFAAAALADRDYSRDRDRDDFNGGRGDRDFYNDDRRGYDGGRGDRFNESSQYQHQEKQPQKSSVADLLKPKARPMEENILKVPTKEQSANFLTDNTTRSLRSKAKPVADPKPVKNTLVKPTPVVDHSAFFADFVSGNKLGNDLKTWIEAQPAKPSVETLVFNLLMETEKSSPDMQCAWAEPDNYGTVLLSLVEDDLLKQMEVLFAIQKYCDKIGMPKLNDEYVVQAMFRSMYKYDLADDESFSLWKEDESPEHETGKLKSVIQTVDWFNWLEEDDEEDDDDYEE